MIYLDNAATGGRKPEQVVRAVETALRRHCANPGRGGHSASLLAGDIVFNCRKKAAAFFGCEDAGNVCFTSGCTAALNMAIKGVVAAGDNVVISSMEHNAVARSAHALGNSGVKVVQAMVVPGDEDATVINFSEQITPHTKAVICTHASNVSGEVLPIARIGELCRRHNAIFIVDAAQTAGVLPINMQEMSIDILCTAPHKGLLAPMGVGLLISRVPLPHTIIQGGTGSLSLEMEQPDSLPDRIESGTLPLPAIAGLSAALDFLSRQDISAAYRREMGLMAYAWDGLQAIPGVVLHSPRPVLGKSVPVLSFNIKNMPSGVAAERLNNMGIAVRGGLQCAPLAHRTLGTTQQGTVRISLSYFNTLSDIRALLAAVRKIAANA
ncbi:MAG: aminotransferase class V-fold PLP-dependent enzyme [Clostridia bacterium]|nr:aminotransferase class V-fold PLP-dependent enzyme [Clostridia bacterium]